MQKDLYSYIPIFILVFVAVSFALANLLISHLIGRKKSDPEKLSPYECGVPPVSSARLRFPIKFYLIAMLFIIFDIETVFLYPWAVVFREMKSLGPFIFIEMVVFIAVLLVGFIYIWKRKAFEWE
ncbi:MAG: NADH-quinone oxidoreductase subunit A [Candidatus Schekmanbacteria bacterium RBG_16_38_11]|uniref:NADH-quinone oxidoreductase subunit A n=2 Tax=Candidatus Schekmaniibacteriota TaxID=1817811 RepID=A0A1F7RRR7_9BACT|nr:MAG: NADH-quinone oxidoreductase subunit A [Candidatus Schekmanbacteria bacterium RBG_16_38_11]